MKPVPKPKTPAIVQNLQWVFNPLGYTETNFRRFGDLHEAQVSPVNPEPFILLYHPEAIQYLLTNDRSEELTAPGEVNAALLKPLLGENSLILIGGQKHRQRRQLMMPPFHGDRMKAYGELICTIARQVIQEWEIGRIIPMRDVMQKITMRVILQAVFGLHEGDRYRKLEQLLAERLNLVTTPITSLFIFFPKLLVDYGSNSLAARVRRLVEQTDELLYAEIRDRRSKFDPNRTDILSLLLSARDENGEGLSDEELHDELMTLLVAGHETTATALAWAFYWIHSLPEVGEKLMQELQPWQDSNDYTAISRLPYLTAVCNETLRIYPVALVTLPRRAEKPIQIMGYDIEPGCLLLGSIYQVHHREDIYPNSHQFNPDRFLERQYSPYEFLPFGGGSRRCIGAALAMYEMTLIIKTIMSECELELAETKPVQPCRRGGTLAPKGGVRMKKTVQKSTSSTPNSPVAIS